MPWPYGHAPALGYPSLRSSFPRRRESTLFLTLPIISGGRLAEALQLLAQLYLRRRIVRQALFFLRDDRRRRLLAEVREFVRALGDLAVQTRDLFFQTRFLCVQIDQ